MDKSKFTSESLGELVQIERADHPKKKDWAFIPVELPPNWEMDRHLWPMLVEARDRLGTLNGIGQTLPDPDLLLRPLQNREAITSSQIEGTFVTAQQLLLFEMDPKEPKSRDDASAGWREVANYNDALRLGCEMIEGRPIGRHALRSMHAVLMRGVRGQDKSPGKFRVQQVQIGSNARFIAPPCTEVDRLMTNLEEYIESEVELDPLIKCFVVHYQFEAIHPFEDGNGRIGRALLALMVYKILGHSRPWLYLSAFFDRYQEEYFANLFNVSAIGDWATWIEYCLRATIVQCNDSIRRCERFLALKRDFHDRVKSPTARTNRIIDRLFQQPIATVTSTKDFFDIHYQTAQRELDLLVDAGILTKASLRRQKTYFASEIMDIAYEDDSDL